MNKLLNSIIGALTIYAVLALTGCGSSDSGSSGLAYNGSSAAAVISPENSRNISTGSSNTAIQALSKDKNPFGASVSSDREFNTKLNTIVMSIAQQQSLPSAVIYTADDLNATPELQGITFCGGSIDGPEGNASNGTLIFNNLCVVYLSDQQIFLNGSIAISGDSTNSTVKYNNFAVTINGETFVISATFTCTRTGNSTSCATLYTDENGKVHKFENDYVVDNLNGSFNIGARYYHPDYGYVDITGNNIIFNCSNGRPSSGSITITGGNNTSASITFTSCNGYDFTYFDGITAGGNSGTW